MNERQIKRRHNAELKAFYSQSSCIDLFSRMENLFLQKFFRYNLSDYFHEDLYNLQDVFHKKLNNMSVRQLASMCFLTKAHLQLSDFQQRVNKFYSTTNQSIQGAQLPFAFKLLYSNCEEATILENQPVFVQVRIGAEVALIERLPLDFYRELELCSEQLTHLQDKEEEGLLKRLKLSGQKAINLMVVYFGDTNFHYFNKEHYQLSSINFFNQNVAVKIHVFYISKIALLESFKRLYKIQRLQYINDLLIHLYERKRQRARHRKQKAIAHKHTNHLASSHPGEESDMMEKLKLFGLVSATMVSIGALIHKLIY